MMYNNAPVRKIMAWLVILTLMTGTCASAVSLDAVSVAAAPLTVNSSALNGMVRVYLSSLGTPSSLTLTVAGNYSVNTSTSLSSGETLMVGFSSSTGAITLTRNGVKTNMGTYFALRRHSASGSNGIKISQARKPANPYPGDLSFRAVQQSNGSYKLYTVAHVYIEEYLYGVLPYEMGSGASLEALKAQAVAARTYTVRMMNARSSNYYDVVDTTSDQVYNGTPTGSDSCVRAVDATKGVVLKNGGSYTMTYYSASNGGQTESAYNAWGSSGYSYLTVKDDPFDYANPDCTVKKTIVQANCSSASNSASLMSLLKTKTVSALSGYGATSSNTVLGTIKSIVAHTPKYASPSKLYTKLDFTLTATVGGTSRTATVTCNIFSELESMLGMSIQSASNELWEVTQSGSTFTIAARRFGHGIGMSQRGAMYMGKLGYTYDEILGFYYVNCQRVGCTFTNTILASNSDETLTTEEDPTDIEDGDSSACTAVVELSGTTAKLAIRSGESSSAAIIGVVTNHSRVNVLAQEGDWVKIKFGELVGYVPANALDISGTVPSSDSTAVSSVVGFGTVTANGYLNLRQSGSYSASVLTTAPTGAVLTVFSKSGAWAHVQYGATAAYAAIDYLSISSSYPSEVADGGSTTATVASDTGSVSLLEAADTAASVIAQLYNGAEVSVSRDDGSWAYVSYQGTAGYLQSAYLSYGDDSSDSGDDSITTVLNATVAVARATLYASADEASEVMAIIAMGQSVVVTEKSSDWCAVRYEGVEGYLPTSTLTFAGSSADVVGTAVVTTASGSLNLRTEASAGSPILTTIPRGATVSVTARGTTWTGVLYGSYAGYVMTTYLTFGTDSSLDDTADETVETTATVTTASGSLNLRQQPKAGSTILRTIPQYATVSVHTKGSEWSQVTYEGTTGYAMSAFLTFAADVPTDAPANEPTEAPQPAPSDEPSGDFPDIEGGTTATPAPTETPNPSDSTDDEAGDSSALTAVVTTASGSLNLRADALPGARVLTRIPQGTRLTILEKLAAWSKTTYGGNTGYVMNTYLTFSTVSVDENATTATVMTASGSLNLRSAPSGSVLRTIPRYATVQVQQRGSTWCYLLYEGVYGYAMTAYLSFGESIEPVTPSEPADELTATVVTPSGSLNLRASQSSSAQVLTTIPRLASVTVTSRGSDWCAVRYQSQSGYVMTTYLQFSSDALTTSNLAATEAPTATDAPASTETPAWVLTSSGSLNLRESASSAAAVLLEMPRLAKVALLEHGDTWSRVIYQGTNGYAMSAYLTLTDPSGQATEAPAETSASTASTPTPTPAPTEAPTYPEDATLVNTSGETYAQIRADVTAFKLYEACSEHSEYLLEMIAGSEVEVLRRGDTWCEIRYFTLTGFCLTEGLNLLDS